MFEESLRDMGSNRNLGSTEVVDQLVRKFVHDVLTADSIADVYGAVNRAAEIFSGTDTSYRTIDGWSGKAGLNDELATRLQIDSGQSDMDMLRSAFGLFARYLFGIVRKSEGEEEIDKLIVYIDALMLGTVSTLYPHARFWFEGPVETGEALAKAHNPGYVRKDGTVVKPFDDSRASRRDNDYPDAEDHPSPDENGKPVNILHPSKPTGPETWNDPRSFAVFVPSGKAPSELNGIPFAEWTDHPEGEDWENVPGVMEDLDEPPLRIPQNKEAATGVVIEEPDGRIWLVSPTNSFGGYKTTYPKGRLEDELSYQANAIKEVFEETGLQVEITGYVGDFERTTTVTRMYRGRRVGGNPTRVGWETQAVKLVPKERLEEIATNKMDMPIHELVKQL